jgi:proteasome lid subunit RPN8/RPN11
MTANFDDDGAPENWRLDDSPPPPAGASEAGPDIHFGDLAQTAPRVRTRPDRNRQLAVVPVHRPRDGDLPVYIDLDVMREMESHAESDTHVELGGVLLGGQFADQDGRPFVVITDSLRARHYESSKGSFKFTHDTWEEITREREQFPSELEMVGWYHTHPGWGVFLSGLDMFICDHFFNKPLDVALVIDPCRQDRGFFQWTQDVAERIRRTDGFFLTASRFRTVELQSYASQLNGTSMNHESRSSASVAYPAPTIHMAPPAPMWQTLAVVGMLSIQFCFLMLITWRLLPVERSGLPMEAAAAGRSDQQPSTALHQREAELDAKLAVLELVVRQGSDAPAGVLKSLTEQTAEAHELRTSLRAQQSLARELDQKVVGLESSLADARRRDERNQAELSALQGKISQLAKSLEEARAEANPTAVEPPGSDDREYSWWTSLLANSKPISFGAILGAAALGAIFAVVQHVRTKESEERRMASEGS